MLIALIALATIGALLGLALGVASRVFRVEGNPLIEELTPLMPGSNCGQCAYPGCVSALEAIVAGSAPPTCCPPGGKALAQTLATRLGLSLDASALVDEGPRMAQVREEICIGCCRCIKACPTDAILGASKQIHNVLREACTGCGKCIDCCPTEAVRLEPVAVSLTHWVWPKPQAL